MLPEPGAFSITYRLKLPRTGLLGNFADFRPQCTNALPFQRSRSIKLARDSRGIRLLRFLVGYRHFAARAKAISHQLPLTLVARGWF